MLIYRQPLFLDSDCFLGNQRPLKNGSDNNSLPFQDHFCLKKGNY